VATKVFLTIEQGATLNKLVHKVRTTMGANVNLQQYSGQCTLKKNVAATSGYSIGVQMTENGEVILQANTDVTGSIPAGRYFYDVLALNLDDSSLHRIIEGYAAVVPAITEYVETGGGGQ
jgi:methenyltetrahydromethanopterin cyclohydrolase